MRYSLAAGVVIATLCLAPWAFGAVEPWFALIAWTACLAAATCLLGVEAARGPAEDPLPGRVHAVLLALPAVALLGLLPLPAALRNLIAPSAAALLDGLTDGAAGWQPLSLVPQTTWFSTIGTAAIAATAWVVLRAAAQPRRARWMVGALLVAGALLAAFGLVQRLVAYDPQKIYWSVELIDVGTPFGPYINRNLFGGLMLLFAGLAAGAVGAALVERRGRAASGAGLVLTLVVAALLATTSRGAILGLAAATTVCLVGAPGGRRLRLLVGIAAVGAVGLGVLAAAGLFEDLAGRLFTLSGRWESRFAVQAEAFDVFLRFPVLGTGAGTFPEVYPAFQSIEPTRHFSHPHSDWMQFLFETGLVGAAAIGAIVAVVLPPIVRGVRRGTNGRPAAAAAWRVLGPAAGCAGICVHGLVSVNLHFPANALLFAATLSLAYAASGRQPDATPSPAQTLATKGPPDCPLSSSAGGPSSAEGESSSREQPGSEVESCPTGALGRSGATGSLGTSASAVPGAGFGPAPTDPDETDQTIAGGLDT